MKNLLYLFLACTITLTSCGSDDDTESSNEDLIIGTWQFVSSSSNGIPNTDINECDLMDTLQFTETMLTEAYHYGENCEEIETDTAIYSIDGDQISVTYTGDNETLIATIETLNNNTLSIKYVEEGDTYTSNHTRL